MSGGIFARSPMACGARFVAQRRLLARLVREAHELDPRCAAELATTILSDLVEHGVGYADFDAPQYSADQIKRALRALRDVT